MATRKGRAERRLSSRVEQALEVCYEYEERIGICTTGEIGLGGVYLVADAHFQRGQLLHLRLRLDDGEWLTIMGEVVYTTNGGAGIKFLGLSEEAQRRLASAMARWGRETVLPLETQWAQAAEWPLSLACVAD